MRPVKLTLCAFGPFSEVEVIEFDALGDKPLFLINGPTGSGKTTILDGICFALYGKTTGDQREAAQMRCDTAAADVLTYVELVFSLGDKVWRIRREPEQQRPKGRGDGFTTHQPRAELYRRDAAGKETILVASKVTEARLEIEALTGLNIGQFRQVMVLPQGEFRNLLMAKSSDRETVFSHLFQTQIYSRIEFALKEQASGLRKELDASRNQQTGILRSADVESEAQLLADIKLQTAHLQESAALKDQASDKRKQAQRLLLEAQNMAADFERLEQARAALQALEQENEAINESSRRLQGSRAALRLQPEFEQWQSALRARESAESGLDETQKLLKQSQIHSLQARDELEKLTIREPDIEIVQRRRHDLEAFRNRVGQYEEARALLETSAQDLTQSKKRRNEYGVQVRDRQQRIEALSQQQITLSKSLKGLANHLLELHRLEGVHRRRADAEDVHTKLLGCTRDLQRLSVARYDAVRQQDESDQALARVELAWHTGQAVILASKLEKDQPCPVCGSEHHPQPATTTDEIPGEKVRKVQASLLTEANEALLQLDKKIAGQEAKKAQLFEQYEALKTVLGSEIDQAVEDVLKAKNMQQKRVQSLQEEQSKEQQINEHMQRLEGELVNLETQMKAAERDCSAVETKNEVARSGMCQAEVELPEEFRISGNLELQVSGCEAQLTVYHEQKKSAMAIDDGARSALGKAEADHDNASKRLKDARQADRLAERQWQQSLNDSLFQNENSFQTARLDDDQMAELDKQLKQHATELEQARGAVNSLQKRLASQEWPNLVVLQRAFDVTEADFETANASYGSVDKRLSMLQSIARKFDAAKDRMKSLEESYAGIGTLADTASGKTGNRVSLQRFVLGVLLDDVLVQASERFKRMSKGRYSLYRQMQKGKGGGASGLELLVDDVYSGKQRPVATLSGGESFMAALSLALGLSDVVQAYAGGIQLDTLFIDEGFGSLDSEALELAVNTLVELQSSGRMVGVISHVPELKERINIRLEVIPGRAGSHTRMVLA